MESLVNIKGLTLALLSQSVCLQIIYALALFLSIGRVEYIVYEIYINLCVIIIIINDNLTPHDREMVFYIYVW
jgi:hypothetical protein